MPGMIDVHTHLDRRDAMQRALASGTTTIRSASVAAYEDISLRELVRTGHLPGPDVVAAGVYVTPNLEETVLADPRLAPLADGNACRSWLVTLVGLLNSHHFAFTDVIGKGETVRAWW